MRDGLSEFDEPALYAMGFSRRSVQVLSVIAKAVNETLPQVVEESGSTVITLTGLQLLVTALQGALANVETEVSDADPHGPVIAALTRALGEQQAELQTVTMNYNNLARRVADLETGVN